MATSRLHRVAASLRLGRLARFCGPGRRSRALDSSVATGRRFVQLDEHPGPFGCTDQKEVDACSVRSGTRRGINWRNPEVLLQNLSRAINVFAAKLDLLDALPKSRQETRNSSGSSRVL